MGYPYPLAKVDDREITVSLYTAFWVVRKQGHGRPKLMRDERGKALLFALDTVPSTLLRVFGHGQYRLYQVDARGRELIGEPCGLVNI